MNSPIRFHLITITLVVGQLWLASAKTINVGLTKTTVMEAGPVGQPVTAYQLNLDIGTPGKQFSMLLDVNGKETWVPHNLALGGIIYHRLHYSKGYSKKASSSSVKEDKEFTINCLGCQLTGKPYEDTVRLVNASSDSGLSNSKLKVRQRFLAISSASNGLLSAYPNDGVLSLNPAFISDIGSRSFLANLQNQQLIDDLKFSLLLNSNLEDSDGGELTFGGLNPARYFGNIYYHNLANNYERWETNLQNVMLGGQVVSCHQKGCTAVLSTGVNEIYGPPEDILRIMNLLNVGKAAKNVKLDNSTNNGETNQLDLYEIECLRVADLPIITIHIDGMAYTIPPAMYIKKKVDGMIFKTSTCYVTIFSNKTPNQWILGTNFLANYYTVFDMNKRQIGFAARKR